MSESEYMNLVLHYPHDSDPRFLSRPRVRGLIWAKTGGHCWYCGVLMNPFTDFCIDHRIPQSRGGTRDYSNLVPSCRVCNSRKRDSSTLEPLRRALTEASGAVVFSERQLEALAAKGIDLSTFDLEPYVFFFEREGLIQDEESL